MSENLGERWEGEREAQAPASDGGTEELRAQLELLFEENRHLRREYRRARQARYRRTALGLAAVGAVALAGGLLFPGSREVLFALSGTGWFAAILTYFLTPERFIAASVGERVYQAYADTGSALVSDLGLTDHRVYVPDDDETRLFVPQRNSYDLPDLTDFDGVFVVDEGDQRRGIALPPTGARLYDEFLADLTGDPATEPGALAEQLADGLLEGFELVDSARPDVEPGRLSVGVNASAYGDMTQFDHPVASFLGVGVATVLEEPVTVEVTDGNDRSDVIVTCRWDEQAPDT